MTNVNQRSSYQVEQRDGCTIIRGQMPMMDLASLLKRQPKSAQMDTNLADRFGALMVIGDPASLEQLARIAPDRQLPVGLSNDSLSEGALDWYRRGEHGSSSKALFAVLAGIDLGLSERDRVAHPRDPADLRRCRLMLEAAPELSSKLGEMARVSPQWHALVCKWDLLCEVMDEETPQWRTSQGSAPATFSLIEECTRTAVTAGNDSESAQNPKSMRP